MSRIGKMPITVPAGVNVTIDGTTVTTKGPKGELNRTFRPYVTISQDGDTITVDRIDDSREAKAQHGLVRTLIANMIEGVDKGFSKKLQLVGVGYRAAVKGKDLEMQLGYSHPVIDRDRCFRCQQGASWPGSCRHSQVAQARALQGQGYSLRGRVHPS